MRKKSLLALIILVLIVSSVLYYYFLPAHGPTIELTRLYGLKLQSGQIVTINVSVYDAELLTAVVLDLAWDPYVLQVAVDDPNGYLLRGVNYSIYLGPFFRDVSNTSKLVVNSVDNLAGKIAGLGLLIFKAGFSANGSGVLATINFVCVNPGTTTIEIVGPSSGRAWVETLINPTISVEHKEVYGLVTDRDPPPIWTGFEFRIIVLAVETVAPLVPLSIIVLKRRPKRVHKKSADEELEDIL
ncbi:MAG: hypothetical protein QXX51_00640 [Candidatus Bathyarchaeia archaeon]